MATVNNDYSCYNQQLPSFETEKQQSLKEQLVKFKLNP
jgi:hypothetical protein